MERTSAPSHPQPRSRRLPRASARGGTGVPIGRNAGGHGAAGMESEEGTAFESLPRRKPCGNTADQPFLLSINFESAVHASLVLQMCALASQGGNFTARKVGQIIARGDRRWLIRAYLGRDHETHKGNITSNHSGSHAGTAGLPDQKIARTPLGTRSGRTSGARLREWKSNPAWS